jgi:hypothetical protein
MTDAHTDAGAAGELRALRADLLAGDLGSLAAHLAATEALAARLAAEGPGAEDIWVIRAEAERNREVLAAAAAGVRAALRRLGEATSPDKVYAPDGRKREIGTPRPSRETRA